MLDIFRKSSPFSRVQSILSPFRIFSSAVENEVYKLVPTNGVLSFLINVGELGPML